MGGVNDQLGDSIGLFGLVKQEAKTCDSDLGAAPFVYLMNKLKYERMSKGDYMSIEPRFSMFNR